MRQVIETPVPGAVRALAERLTARHPGTAAVLMYGSCLRSGDPYDGLVDLYVLVDDYTRTYDRRWLAWANRLLPPNVFYAEIRHEGRTVRSKYAVLTLADFQGGTLDWFHSYLWGRFSQPCRLVWRRDGAVAERIAACLVAAAARFVSETAPLLPPCFDTATLWQTSLRSSYGAELRAEKAAERARQLYRWAQDYYQRLTPSLLAGLPYRLRRRQALWCLDIPAPVRRWYRWRWRLRSIQGKVLSLLRLVKALFTFQGGVDYILWKLTRHTGRTIEVPARVRRHPLIYGWGLLWRLYREGVFR
ncbi:hypothetical protein MIT9_P1281 [Methylomarinovum caldicuralii]|uniref:Phosphatidate cytidylyltransferase n=1 Tax=Methylomarinovum caldicuralii TaxID=438856 RepID=A0AAU9C288_9GAMM|nr:hypothetical protein MIT9_P1281 [Methylomarinovum caldicuralii]